MAKIDKAVRALDKVMQYHYGLDASESINMLNFAKCALGQYVRANHDTVLNGYNSDEITEQVFGITLNLWTGTAAKKWALPLAKLFSGKPNSLERGTWLKAAEIVLQKLSEKAEEKRAKKNQK